MTEIAVRATRIPLPLSPRRRRLLGRAGRGVGSGARHFDRLRILLKEALEAEPEAETLRLQEELRPQFGSS